VIISFLFQSRKFCH